MTLYLGIPEDSGIDWTSFHSYAIQQNLTTWLSSCGVGPVSVKIVGKPQPQMTPADGLVYLVGYNSDSIVSRVGAPESSELRAGQTSGLRGEMISEVYVNPMRDYEISATIYHELLHNKFRLAVDIHRTADANFTSAVAPFFDGGPFKADQELMAQALQQNSRQFQGGFTAARLP